ncbi:GNAT family N-acetyltransferase [Ideonella sp.]|uniref:GNAT family N-acetyltransferase n=1 Tax=Ideonella sp. TaxID=1929293 RepID=UPI003BB756E2
MSAGIHADASAVTHDQGVLGTLPGAFISEGDDQDSLIRSKNAISQQAKKSQFLVASNISWAVRLKKTAKLTFRLASECDFRYIYDLCEVTMRTCVEADLGNCFESIAQPAIRNLLQRGAFSKIYAGGVLVGVFACERHVTHIQLEEIYIEPASQRLGLGTEVMRRIIRESESVVLPIRLHVLASNPALAFYEKLGFETVRSAPAVIYMERVPLGTRSTPQTLLCAATNEASLLSEVSK